MQKDTREGWDETDYALDAQGEGLAVATGTELRNMTM